MSDSLFRKEALDANKPKSIGSVTLYFPVSRWVIISLVGVIALITLLFFFFGSYTKRENATGALVPVDGVMDIVAMNTGTITELQMTEGDQVKKGAPLVTISSETATKFGKTRETIADQLNLQHDTLLNELKNRDQLSRETRQGLEQQQKLLEQQLKKFADIQGSRQKQARLARNQVNKLYLMQKEGYASNTQIEQLETSLLEAESRLQEAERQRLDLQQQLNHTRQQLRELPINDLNQRNNIEQRLAELKQNMLENESRRMVVINAPQNATIASVLTKKGQVVSAGQTIASLLPENATLQARIMVSSRVVGFIQPGQRVVLRYQAYPWQKFGQQYGVVSEVSRISLSPQEVAHVTGSTQVKEAHYLVKVTLDNQVIHAYGRQVRLQPGSALEADFLIDKRRLYEWVLEPIYALSRSTSI